MKASSLAATLGFALALGVLAFLWSGGFFDQYHGEAVAWRPLPGAQDGSGGMVRVVLQQAGGSWAEVKLPGDDFAGRGLPRSPAGIPPRERPEGAVTVHKDLFAFHVRIGDTRRTTLHPADLLVPVLVVALVVALRNLAVAGSVLRWEPGDGPRAPLGMARGGPRIAPPGPATPHRPEFGPPPPKRGRRKPR